MAPRRRVAAAAVGLAALAALSGCAAEQPAPADTTASTPVTATPGAATPGTTGTPAPAPAEPVLQLEGSASDNLAFFTVVVQQVAASEQKAEGRAYVDALVKAGFDKSAMQVTQDRTTVGNAAEALQFSVLWQGECLVGQAGPEVEGAVARVLPALQGGTVCLVGSTRPIDW